MRSATHQVTGRHAAGLVARWCVGALLGLVGACGPAEPLSPRPGADIVLISIDTLRADHLGSYGQSRPTSTFLDAFARQSLVFEGTLAPSNNTAPSHMSLFTGVSVPVHGLDHRDPRPPPMNLPLLTEVLHDAGYRTLGLADGGYVTAPFGFDRGFDEFHSELRPLVHKLPRLRTWIETPSDQPTFLFLHTYDVHAPYIPSPEFDLFTDRDYRGPFRERLDKFREAFADPALTYEMGVLANNFWEQDKHQLSPEDLAYLEALYAGEIAQLDALFGQLLPLFERHGWFDDAWIVITSDHGEAFGEHGTVEHRQLYQEELHVPLIIRPPGGLPEPVRIAGTTRLLDLAPTLLVAVGLNPPVTMEGIPMQPEARGTSRDLPVLAVSGESPDFRALVLGDHKLILNGPRPPVFHDLGADPGERHDLAGPEAPAWTAGLRRLLEGLERDARARRARLEAGATSGAEAVTLTPEVREELERLGYVGGNGR